MGDCPIGPQKVDTNEGYNRSDSSSKIIRLLPEARVRQLEGRNLDNFISSVPKCLKDYNIKIIKLCPIENQYVRCGSPSAFLTSAATYTPGSMNSFLQTLHQDV